VADKLKRLITIVRKKFRTISKKSPAHDITHVERVVRNVKILGKEEQGDMDVLIPAAWLHDIARECGERHAREGAVQARSILKKLSYPEPLIKRICEAIAMHSSSDRVRTHSREGRILFDADKMDAVGPVLIARWFHKNGREGKSLNEAVASLEDVIRWAKGTTGTGTIFFTRTARNASKQRLAYSLDFLKRLKKELATQ
jgi:uncharacterized protein